MINLEKIKYENASPSFEEDLLLHYTSTPFLKFSGSPPSGGSNWNLLPPFLKRRGPNYDCQNDKLAKWWLYSLCSLFDHFFKFQDFI